jgi:hypothetical protein
MEASTEVEGSCVNRRENTCLWCFDYGTLPGIAGSVAVHAGSWVEVEEESGQMFFILPQVPH